MAGKISCIVHTRNSEATLEKALSSVDWVDELVVVDMQSEDETLKIAANYADRILKAEPAPRIDGVRNAFLKELNHQWALVLDSDEYLALDAAQNIKSLIKQHGDNFDAFAFPRFNYLAGVPLMGGGRYPDHQIRLFRNGSVKWHDSNHQLPEVITGPDRLMKLTPPNCLHIHHPNYENLQEFMAKQISYALNDTYPQDPAAFEFSEYIARAHEQLALRSEPQTDGDVSHALALVMAWDSLLRGLIHWDRLDPKPPLNYLSALPAGATKVPHSKIALRKMLGRHLAWKHILAALVYRLRRLLHKFKPGRKRDSQ